MKDNKFEVYKVTNRVNNKIYVGITNQGHKNRWYKHCSDAIRDCGFPLHLAMRSHGIDFFTIEVIDTANSYDELKEKEKFWIKELKSNDREIGYNLTEGGDGTFGRRHSEETRLKISLKKKGKRWSEEYRNFAINSGLYGKTVKQFSLNGDLIQIYPTASEAARILNFNARVVAAAASGKLKTYKGFVWEYSDEKKVKFFFNNPNKIKKEKYHPTEEVKKRISETNKLRWNDERKQKQSLNNFKNRPILQYTLDGQFVKEYYNVAQVVKELGLTTHTNVAKCARGTRKKAAGYVWKYKDFQEAA